MTVALGLAGFGTCTAGLRSLEELTADRPEDLERLRGYGYRALHVAPDDTGLTDLAETAAERALAGSGTAPEDVDLVVLAVTDLAEHLCWDAAAALAARLGADRAEAVLGTQACTGGLVALDTVAGRLATHPSYDTALVVAAHRVVELYTPRLDSQPLLASDGAAAVVVRRDHPRWRWRATETVTDGSLADLFRMVGGGAQVPFDVLAPGQQQPRTGDAWSAMEHFDYDATRFGAFMSDLDTRLAEVLHAACRRSGLRPDDVVRLLLTHDTSEAHRLALAALGLPEERGNAALAAAHGHLGAADQLHDLAVLDAEGECDPGDVVALLGRGRGMHWACTLLEA